MKCWNDYYKRSAYLEGMAGAFDLFGENSSFNPPVARFKERQFITYVLRKSYAEAGKHLKKAMKFFDYEKKIK